jgi:hypothetical protein
MESQISAFSASLKRLPIFASSLKRQFQSFSGCYVDELSAQAIQCGLTPSRVRPA